MIGNGHLENIIPKFLHNKARYPKIAVFDILEYHFNTDLQMHQVPKSFLEMMDIQDHLPQAVVLLVGGNDIDVATKAQARARVEDMLMDIMVMWVKFKPATSFHLGLFVSILPPQLWYKGFHQQKVGWEVCCSLNLHLGKIAKEVQATVIPHHVPTHGETQQNCQNPGTT